MVGAFLVISLTAFSLDSDWPTPSSRGQKSKILAPSSGCSGSTGILGGISPDSGQSSCPTTPCAADTTCEWKLLPVLQNWEVLYTEPYQCCSSCTGAKITWKVTCEDSCFCSKNGSECPQVLSCDYGTFVSYECASCCQPCYQAGTPSIAPDAFLGCDNPSCGGVPGDCGGGGWLEKHPITVKYEKCECP